MKPLLFTLAVLVLLNLLSLAFNKIDCSYSNANGSFTFEEENFKQRDYLMCQRKLLRFKRENKTDTTLYRLCSKNVFKFWNWGHYLFDAKFQLPYMAWYQIQMIRPPLKDKSGYQDF